MAESESPKFPNPDPTVLTTERLLQEAQRLREEIKTHVDALKEVIETRLDGMDKGIILLQTVIDKYADKFPSLVDTSMHRTQVLQEEKLRVVSQQFEEKFRGVETQFRDSKVAIDAALQAAKDAVTEQNRSSALAIAKAEAATTKQIDQIALMIGTTTKNVDGKIDDVKSRITSIESRSKGGADVWAMIVGGIGIVGIIASIIFAILTAASRN